jgi:hypothetical protein
VAVDVNAFKDFVDFFEALAARTECGDFIPSPIKCARLLPDAAVKRNRKVLDNNQDFSHRGGRTMPF